MGVASADKISARFGDRMLCCGPGLSRSWPCLNVPGARPVRVARGAGPAYPGCGALVRALPGFAEGTAGLLAVAGSAVAGGSLHGEWLGAGGWQAERVVVDVGHAPVEALSLIHI